MFDRTKKLFKDNRGILGSNTFMNAAVLAAVGFLVLVLVVSLLADVMTSIQASQTVNSTAYNVSAKGLTGFTNFSSQFGNVGLILAIGLIIAIVATAIVVFQRR